MSSRGARHPHLQADVVAPCDGAEASTNPSVDRMARGHVIPVRRRASVDGAPLRAAFLLSHVDGRMSVVELAASAQIPLDDAIECFELLADLGVVELRPTKRELGEASPGQPPVDALLVTPKSGLHKKT